MERPYLLSLVLKGIILKGVGNSEEQIAEQNCLIDITLQLSYIY
jgi:hypothetical protein